MISAHELMAAVPVRITGEVSTAVAISATIDETVELPSHLLGIFHANHMVVNGNLLEEQITGVHTLQSVPVYAQGPGADCLGRGQENIGVYFCMATAIGLNPAGE